MNRTIETEYTLREKLEALLAACGGERLQGEALTIEALDSHWVGFLVRPSNEVGSKTYEILEVDHLYKDFVEKFASLRLESDLSTPMLVTRAQEQFPLLADNLAACMTSYLGEGEVTMYRFKDARTLLSRLRKSGLVIE